MSLTSSQLGYPQDYDYDDMPFYDDISIDAISFEKWTEGTLYRVSFGVGGGNGGYMTFSLSPGGTTLLAETFDGDLEFCHEKIMGMGNRSKTSSK